VIAVADNDDVDPLPKQRSSLDGCRASRHGRVVKMVGKLGRHVGDETSAMTDRAAMFFHCSFGNRI
jgi:hypothetical protein